MERKRFTIAGAVFSAPSPVGAAIYARLKENCANDLRALGATDKDISSDTKWFVWLKKLLEEKPILGALHILQSLLRPESGASVLDAFESDTTGEVGVAINFFTESMRALLPAETKSANGSPNIRRPKAKPKR